MDHISEILAPPTMRGRFASAAVADLWHQAAVAAHAVARSRTRDPATLKQLRRVCQLLTSHTVRERERRRAFLRLTRGCTKDQASAMLDYFIPTVRARRAAAARASLGPPAA